MAAFLLLPFSASAFAAAAASCCAMRRWILRSSNVRAFFRACARGEKRAGGGGEGGQARDRGRRRARVDVRGRRASRLPHLSDAFYAVVELLSSVLVGDVLAGVIPTLLPLWPSLTLRTHG